MRSILKRCIAMLLFCAAVVMCTAGGGVAEPAKSGAHPNWPAHLRFIVGPSGGQWHMLGDLVAEVVSRRLLPTTSRLGGGVANIKSISDKQGDFAFSLTCFMGAAQSGESDYLRLVPDSDNTVMMMNVYPQVLYFIVRKDFAERNGITDVASLLQTKMHLRLASLKKGTASEFLLSLLLKYGYDTSLEQLQEHGWKISFNNYAEMTDNFVSGALDCVAYTAGTEVPLILSMEKYADVLILPVDQGVLDLLEQRFKTRTHTIPPGIYKSVNSPTETLGSYTCIIVRKDLPEDLIYELNKAIWEGRDYISSAITDFKSLSPDTALQNGLEMHPGSLKFWRELQQEGK